MQTYTVAEAAIKFLLTDSTVEAGAIKHSPGTGEGGGGGGSALLTWIP